MLSHHPHPGCLGIGLLLLLGFLVVDVLTQMEAELPVWYNPYSSPVTEAPEAKQPVAAVVPSQSQGYGHNLQGSYNGRILGKKSENQTFALFWSEFGGIFKSLEKFGGI